MIYYVTQDETCAKCLGEGVTQHPGWKRYWEENPDGLRDGNADIQWFHDRGYGSYPPPEEIECVSCKGKGRVCLQVDLLTALARLGFSIQESD